MASPPAAPPHRIRVAQPDVAGLPRQPDHERAPGRGIHARRILRADVQAGRTRYWPQRSRGDDHRAPEHAARDGLEAVLNHRRCLERGETQRRRRIDEPGEVGTVERDDERVTGGQDDVRLPETHDDREVDIAELRDEVDRGAIVRDGRAVAVAGRGSEARSLNARTGSWPVPDSRSMGGVASAVPTRRAVGSTAARQPAQPISTIPPALPVSDPSAMVTSNVS